MSDSTPPDPDASAAALDALAAGPRRVTGDAGSVEQHSVSDLIAYDEYQRARAAASSPRRGLRFTKLIPPGAV